MHSRLYLGSLEGCLLWLSGTGSSEILRLGRVVEGAFADLAAGGIVSAACFCLVEGAFADLVAAAFASSASRSLQVSLEAERPNPGILLILTTRLIRKLCPSFRNFGRSFLFGVLQHRHRTSVMLSCFL
ncbi:hypothetical protein MTO96_025443 [Rhipicephalus appendiculatus]